MPPLPRNAPTVYLELLPPGTHTYIRSRELAANRAFKFDGGGPLERCGIILAWLRNGGGIGCLDRSESIRTKWCNVGFYLASFAWLWDEREAVVYVKGLVYTYQVFERRCVTLMYTWLRIQ